jgi:hypothetical protein
MKGFWPPEAKLMVNLGPPAAPYPKAALKHSHVPTPVFCFWPFFFSNFSLEIFSYL